MLERSVAQYREALGDAHPSVVNGLNVLGASRMHTGDYAGAEHDFREALRLADLAPGGARARLEIRGNLASVLASSKRAEEGLRMLEAAWADAQDEDLPAELKIGLMLNLGAMNDGAGRLGRARELLTGAVELARRVDGEGSVVYAKCLGARAQLEHVELTRALADADIAVGILAAKLGPDVVWTADARLQRATVLSRLHRCDEVLAELDPITAAFAKIVGPDHPHLDEIELLRAICHAKLGRHATAIAEIEALEARGNLDGVVPELEGWLVRAYAGDGRPQEAALRYDTALRKSMTPEQREIFAAIVPTRP